MNTNSFKSISSVSTHVVQHSVPLQYFLQSASCRLNQYNNSTTDTNKKTRATSHNKTFCIAVWQSNLYQ